MENLNGKHIILGVTGGIAAYKAADIASALRKAGAGVHVIMTGNAAEFITPLTFETLTGNRCVTDTFARDFQYDVAHVSLAKSADLIIIAPATADIIAKLAHGIADDMLTTTVLAAKCPKLIAPAMNTAMLENPITGDNIKTLTKYGFEIIPPDSGALACGDTGSGRLPDKQVILDHIALKLAREKTLSKKRVTVTAGPTREEIDPVRFITNHSTGKMGYAIAREAVMRGAEVKVISGAVSLPPVPFAKTERALSAADMLKSVEKALPGTDILVMCAAVADYRPAAAAKDKIKKSGESISLPLSRTEDILAGISANKPDGLFVCGFSMETQNVIENSREKLISKKLDMIIANDLNTPGAGFAGDTNVITVITPDGCAGLPLMSKSDAAAKIFDMIEQRIKRKERA